MAQFHDLHSIIKAAPGGAPIEVEIFSHGGALLAQRDDPDVPLDVVGFTKEQVSILRHILNSAYFGGLID